MNIQHKNLAGDKWDKMPFIEKLANTGSEVERALNWKKKNNPEYAEKALTRALELLEITIGSTGEYSRLRELARLREALLDYFYGSNSYGSTEEMWRKYFYYFAFAARRSR